jgi:hypothetical protein
VGAGPATRPGSTAARRGGVLRLRCGHRHGCLLDGSATEALAVVAEDDYEEISERVYQETAATFDAGSNVNCIAFLSGWGDGSYPVWIGRDAEGEVVCFVADMLLLADATVLSEETATAS